MIKKNGIPRDALFLSMSAPLLIDVYLLLSMTVNINFTLSQITL